MESDLTLDAWAREPGPRSALRWTVARPLRAFAAARWLPRGRSLIARVAQRLAWIAAQAAQRVAWATVQPGTPISARTPGGSRVAFGADTMIGRALWTYGTFEHEELVVAGRLATPGTCAIDVGANIGLFTVDISRSVGPDGNVIAVEPVPSTVQQLRSNLEANGCDNVEVVVGAAGSETGEIELLLTDDPALHSAGGKPIAGHTILEVTTVSAFTLDELWVAAGSPRVSFMKIDVEGGEKGVLLGATRMISDSRPAIIIEVVGAEQLAEVLGLLSGYRPVEAPGFEPWNHLLLPR
jgi:FkbM family methyltransferase